MSDNNYPNIAYTTVFTRKFKFDTREDDVHNFQNVRVILYSQAVNGKYVVEN